jgi:predicted glycoside hydrolase/deacetylase ChbG (UPF0249 family)
MLDFGWRLHPKSILFLGVRLWALGFSWEIVGWVEECWRWRKPALGTAFLKEITQHTQPKFISEFIRRFETWCGDRLREYQILDLCN